MTTDRGVLGPVVGRRRGYRRSGFYTLKATLRQLGPRVIDRRTTLGKQLAAWRAELIRDLGGNPSTAQQQLVELAVRTKLLLDSLDAWLLAQRSLVNSTTKSVLPVVKERTALANHLQGCSVISASSGARCRRLTCKATWRPKPTAGRDEKA